MIHEQAPEKKQEKQNISQEKIEQIKEKFIEFLEELVTNPETADRFGVPTEAPEMIRRGEKIYWHQILHGRLSLISQDFRTTPDEFDFIQKKIFKNQ
ncbi:MAG: hypothetical protein HYT93_04840 [Parcubacteria group bacterium]|nr:hypothetical protein [Parcubacteria group bacterium]